MKKKIIGECNRIVSNKRVGVKYFEIILESSKIASYSAPGQFIEVKASSGLDPLLRRPFSIHRIGIRDTGYVQRKKTGRQQQGFVGILYQVVGKGTEILSQKKPGEYLDIIGPLGNGFIYRNQKLETRNSILVAGGMGVAPLLFLAERFTEHKSTRIQEHKIIVLLGARSKDGILCEREFKKLGCIVKAATDDGTKGFKGRVTDLLENLLLTINYRLSTVFACGPKPMLKALTQISKQYNIPAQISLESHMACGIGACLGCVINTTGGFKRVCKEGPVFNAEEIIWQYDFLEII